MWPLSKVFLRTVSQVHLKHHIERLLVVIAHGEIHFDVIQLHLCQASPLDREIGGQFNEIESESEGACVPSQVQHSTDEDDLPSAH